MNDAREHSQPHMLAMHKTVTKTSDGTRQLIFYSFDEKSRDEKVVLPTKKR